MKKVWGGLECFLETFDGIVMPEDFGALLKEFIEEKYASNASEKYTGSVTNAAWIWGVTKPMVIHVINGDRKPNPAILDDIGYDHHTITFYTKRN